MKLDLFYEFDAARPWDGPHPHGQRAREKKTYKEAFEQITLADKFGFNTSWHVEHHFREGRSHSPAPEVIIGALSQCTENLRLGFGVTLLPHAFTPPMRVAGPPFNAEEFDLDRRRCDWPRIEPRSQAGLGPRFALRHLRPPAPDRRPNPPS